MDNVAAHLQRLQLGGSRRRTRSSAHGSAHGSATTVTATSDPHACMRRLLAGTLRTGTDDNNGSGAALRRQPPAFQVAFARACQGRAARLLAAVDEDGGVALVDTARATGSAPGSSAVVSYWTAHENAVFDVAWARDNTFLLTASGDLRATAWDAETQRARFSLAGGHAMSVKCVRQSGDHDHTVATGARDGHVLVWDARVPAAPVAQLRGVHSFAPVAPPLASSSPARQSFLSPPSSARKRRRTGALSAAASPSPSRAGTATAAATSTPRSVTSVEFLGGGHELATAGALDGVVKIWDLRRLTAPRKIPLASHNSNVSASVVPVRSFACGSAGSAQRGITSLALDPASRSRLLVSALHGELSVLDAHARSPERAVVARFEGHAASSFYVKSAFSPDGDFVVSGSGDGAVYLWDTTRHVGGRPLAPSWALKAHEAEVNGVAWHASDFATLATCSDDGSVRVWRADRREDEEGEDDERFRLRRRNGAWQNWQEWQALDDGRAYAVETLDEEEPEEEQEEQENETRKVFSPPPVDAAPRPPFALREWPSTTRAAAPSSSAPRRPQPQKPQKPLRKCQTLLDFWGKRS